MTRQPRLVSVSGAVNRSARFGGRWWVRRYRLTASRSGRRRGPVPAVHLDRVFAEDGGDERGCFFGVEGGGRVAVGQLRVTVAGPGAGAEQPAGHQKPPRLADGDGPYRTP